MEETRAPELLAPEGGEGEPAPRAPQVEEEPRGGMPTTPAPASQSGERSSVPTTVVLPMPWEEQGSLSAGRALKKSAPPLSAVKAEPEFKKQRIEEESAKRARREEPGAASSSTPQPTSHEQMVERRVEKVCVGEEEMYHLDEVIESETIELEVDEDVTPAVQEQDQPEVWSEATLTRTPPQPSDEAEALADQTEERRLKNMGVIEDLKVEDFYLDKLTTKFVPDWRIKTRTLPDGQQKKRWMRRSRLVARESWRTSRQSFLTSLTPNDVNVNFPKKNNDNVKLLAHGPKPHRCNAQLFFPRHCASAPSHLTSTALYSSQLYRGGDILKPQGRN